MERVDNKNYTICPYEVHYDVFNVPDARLKWCEDYKSSNKFRYNVEENANDLYVIFGFESELDSLVFKLAQGL